MHIMGLHDDFKRALEFVEHSHFSLPQVRAPSQLLVPFLVLSNLH
jgi:hypothetical protein